MCSKNSWTFESDSLLQYLHLNLKIYNWATVSLELNKRLGMSTTQEDCRNRYALLDLDMLRNLDP